MGFQIGDRVKILPMSSITPKYHNLKGVIRDVRDENTSSERYFVKFNEGVNNGAIVLGGLWFNSYQLVISS